MYTEFSRTPEYHANPQGLCDSEPKTPCDYQPMMEVISKALSTTDVAVSNAETASREAQIDALASIYCLHYELEQNPENREYFFEKFQIKPSPNSKYVAHPLVRFLLTEFQPSKTLLPKITYWAGAIDAAYETKVEPETFTQFIKSKEGGIQGAYKIAAKSAVGKYKRLERAIAFDQAEQVFRRDIHPINVPKCDFTEGLEIGKHLCILEVSEDGNPSLTARLDATKNEVEAKYRKHVEAYVSGDAAKGKAKPISRKRYEKSKVRPSSIVLSPDDPAAVEERTRHPHLVVTPSNDDWVLKSGEHSRKLGSVVTKGKWKGYPIFGLSLEERATCPRTCKQWLNCYGNGMGQMRAYRYEHGPKLIDALERELTILSSEPKTRNGFVVRLHTLGDFYNVEYVERWEQWLTEFPALKVFGFTAWESDTDIGSALKQVRDTHWDRFAMRFSNQPHERFASSVIGSEDQGPEKGTGIICPAELGQTASCSTCGYCWQSEKHVSFVEH